jgi:dihydroflavonol-4-reductase
VRGSVRDPSNEARLAPIKAALGDLFTNLELVQADLLDEASINRTVEGCDLVVHTASPLPIRPPEDEQEVIRPAVDGTLAVLRAAHKHGVKRVVVTSSTVAVTFRRAENQKELYDEGDWSDMDACYTAYDKSKNLAEKAAWDYH